MLSPRSRRLRGEKFGLARVGVVEAVPPAVVGGAVAVGIVHLLEGHGLGVSVAEDDVDLLAVALGGGGAVGGVAVVAAGVRVLSGAGRRRALAAAPGAHVQRHP